MSTEPAGACILVVDDHLEMARLLADHLGGAGPRGEAVGSGADAIASLRVRRFDLVFTDLRMEQVDGLDVLAAARDVDPELPVLIMTAFGAVETAVEAMRRGAFHYLTKPFRLDEVQLVVERALEDRRL